MDQMEFHKTPFSFHYFLKTIILCRYFRIYLLYISLYSSAKNQEVQTEKPNDIKYLVKQ